ncbi:uncharacterized protein [Watersipora subatra]|uniref:uncharacterized protein n=1 Tax=Watersipora subatra TaxID=2589382 RepID=UPI00355C2EB1
MVNSHSGKPLKSSALDTSQHNSHHTARSSKSQKGATAQSFRSSSYRSGSVKSRSSSSKSRSSISILRMKMAEIAEQEVELQAKLENEKLEHELQQKRTEIEQAKIQAKITAEKRKKDIILQAINEEQEETNLSPVLLRPPTKPPLSVKSQVTSNPGLQSLVLSQNENSHEIISPQLTNAIVNSITSAMNLSRLPPPEPFVFYGNPLEYADWKIAFDTLIDQRNGTTVEKLHYLKRYVSGAAKEAVDGYFLLQSPEAYNKAKQTLQDRFGDSLLIADRFRDKIDQWPKITSKDGVGLRKFSDFLNQCQAALASVPELSILNDSRENRKMAAKLPDWLHNQWVRTATKARQKDKGKYPSFADFCSFIAEEAEIACNAMLAKNPADANDKTSAKRDRKITLKTNTIETTLSDNNKSIVINAAQQKTSFCKFYSEPRRHLTTECHDLAKQPHEKKQEFVKMNSLCFSCLEKTSATHRSKTCTNKATCSKCTKAHPTSLHIEYPTSYSPDMPSGSKSNQAFKDKKHNDSQVSKADPKHEANEEKHVSHNLETPSVVKAASMTIPVWVSSANEPNKEMLVYALLDSQSSSSFVTTSVANATNASKTETMLNLATMTSSSSTIKCQKVTGLRVRGQDSKRIIKLPPAYAKDEIPAIKEHIPTRKSVNAWPHLRRVVAEMGADHDVNTPLGLLIGYDCPLAFRSSENVIGNDTEPFAMKTELGWVVMGNLNSRNQMNDRSICHKVVSKEIMSPHNETRNMVNFLVKKDTYSNIETDTKTEILQVMSTDFTDTKVTETGLSVEDQQFIQIMKENTHRDSQGYVAMPLPLKSTPSSPNTLPSAKHRLNLLLEKLAKEARKEVKRYGLVSTCMSSRAVHLQLLNDMSTDSFINALQSFIAIRGSVRQIRCDQGTNFVGAMSELTKELQKQLPNQSMNTEFVSNPPHTFHTGGVWERQIHTVRSFLKGLFCRHGGRFDSATLRTILFEVMAIVNSQPLGLITDEQVPHTPNLLLTIKSDVVLPPPGQFPEPDVYSRKHWKQFQYIANEFWKRWRTDYLSTLQQRQKWNKPTKDIKVGGIVVVNDSDAVRNDWKLAKVVQCNKSRDGLVRSARVLIANPDYRKGTNKRQHLDRPVTKTVFLVENKL